MHWLEAVENRSYNPQTWPLRLTLHSPSSECKEAGELEWREGEGSDLMRDDSIPLDGFA